MDRELSSKWTFFYKFVLPAAIVIGMGVALIVMNPRRNAAVRASLQAWYVLVGIWLLLAIYIFVVSKRLKYLRLDGDALLISNFQRSWRVPLSNIAAVKRVPSNGRSPIVIRIELRGDVGFGKVMTFIPSVMAFMDTESVDQVVYDLQARAGLKSA